MRVRAAVERDAEAVAHVHVESWRSTYRGLVPDDYLAGLSVERRADNWRRLIKRLKSRILLLKVSRPSRSSRKHAVTLTTALRALRSSASASCGRWAAKAMMRLISLSSPPM